MFSIESKPNITDSGPFVYSNDISLTVRRLDLVDDITGGNKWYKLLFNLIHFKQSGLSSLVTFGGAYSNHIAAVARAGKLEGIQTTGIIRGEARSITNPTLSRAVNDGMKLLFVSRSDYRKKNETQWLMALLPDFKNCMIIPEGGSNADGVKGCMQILTAADAQYSHITLACGTGATAAGLILTLKPHQRLIGINVLKNENSLETSIKNYLDLFRQPININWNVNHEFHFGGYAKSATELSDFIKYFFFKTGIPTETVYTGKLFYGLEQLIKSNYFSPGSKILAIHTGGLQYLNPV